MEIKISDVDIFGKKLGLFYKNKEKISSYFGLLITFFYIFISLGIFLYYTIRTLKHKDLTVNDSTIYSKDIPNINLNNSDLLYFAFAVEKPGSASRFIDETIYTVKAIFYDAIKNENGTFEPNEVKDLKIERCNQKKFGDDYQHLFTKKELNNSYCLNTLDFVLRGGFIYEKLSLIRIDIYPCKNSTENNFHCQPQEIIDKFLSGGYFSILSKDVGLNPSNYTFPVLPTVQDVYTTISKQFFKDLILFYEITEIWTDSGIVFENIEKKRYLKFDRKIETLFLRTDEDYYSGESIIGLQIRLSDNIHVQNREYKKIHNVFATAGGYMQMLNTFFSLLSIFPNKFFYDNIIVNNLFNFDKKKKKITFKNTKFNNYNNKQYISDLDIKQEKRGNKIVLNLNNKEENINNESKSENKSRSNLNNLNKNINVSAYEKMNNTPNNELFPFSTGLNLVKKTKLIYVGKKKSTELKNNYNNNEDNSNYIHFNLSIIDYLCLGRCKDPQKQYHQFRKGLIIFRQKLDIINIFNCILFCEKINEEEI